MLLSEFAVKKHEPQRNQKKNRHHHKAYEEHEVKKSKCDDFPIPRVLRALRGDIVFTY
jgi:hypothetical protein